MPQLRFELSNFLKDNFNGGKIHNPLIFNYPNAIRFDLQTDGEADSQYFNEVFFRAKALFETSFDAEDEIYLIMHAHKYRRHKIRASNFCFKQISHLKPAEISYSLGRQMYEEGAKSDFYNIAVLRRKVKDINYSNILTAIANTDFPSRQPRLDDINKEIFFVNIKKKLIFHMYDDRGLYIAACDIETLRPIFKKYNNWILEFNRKGIEAAFN